MKVDLHTHILPKNWPDLRERYGYGGFIQLDHHKSGCARMMVDGQCFREIEDNCWDLERRLEHCEKHGVRMQVLSTVPVMFNYWAKPEHTLDLARLLNDHLAEVITRYPDRFTALGTVPLQAPDLAIAELERCVRDLHFPGVQIGTHVNGKNLNDPDLFPLFQRAEQLGACIFVHPWDMLGKERMQQYWMRWLVGMPAETCLAICSVIFGGVLERLPQLRMCFAHGGGSFPGTIGRIEHGFQSRPDLCAIDNGQSPRNYLGKFFVDSLVHDALALRYLIELLGEHRVALGTDYPFPLGEARPGELIQTLTNVSAQTQRKLLAENALEFLGHESENAFMSFQADQDFARALDAADPLHRFRERFHFPQQPDGSPFVYLCGHSLGLQPKATRGLIEQELDDWSRLGVEGHFDGTTPWYSYHEIFREPGARLVGALPGEVVMMNSLTVNLHLMLTTFFQPDGSRRKILIDTPAFPSDLFALQTHLRVRGCDPHKDLITVSPRDAESYLRMDHVEAVLAERGHEIALVLWNGVNFYTGQFFNIERLATLARNHGCVFGLDLAHAAGNVPLRLHDWQVDFAVWCSYKYLNSGPGAVGGCFVHEKHGRNKELPRLAGWWGTDPATRFQMEDGDFAPQAGAEGWQVSNPPILAMAPLRASLSLFDEAGMSALRAKSEQLTAYLWYLLERQAGEAFSIMTPARAEERGCQLSLLVYQQPRTLFKALHAAGVLCDFREPNVIRVAPVPLYNSFHDVWMFASTLTALAMGEEARG